MDRDWPVPMDELRRASAEALLVPLKARADAIEAEIRDELAAEGLALVNAAEVWAKIEEYREASEEWAFATERFVYDVPRTKQAINDAANDIRAALGLDQLP